MTFVQNLQMHFLTFIRLFKSESLTKKKIKQNDWFRKYKKIHCNSFIFSSIHIFCTHERLWKVTKCYKKTKICVHLIKNLWTPIQISKIAPCVNMFVPGNDLIITGHGFDKSKIVTFFLFFCFNFDSKFKAVYQ